MTKYALHIITFKELIPMEPFIQSLLVSWYRGRGGYLTFTKLYEVCSVGQCLAEPMRRDPAELPYTSLLATLAVATEFFVTVI
jgi:hypothetical protein